MKPLDGLYLHRLQAAPLRALIAIMRTASLSHGSNLSVPYACPLMFRERRISTPESTYDVAEAQGISFPAFFRQPLSTTLAPFLQSARATGENEDARTHSRQANK